jgi:hypothetical protein
MKFIGERISFNDDKNKTTIIIEPEKKFAVNALMGAWLAMWYVIGIVVIWSIFTFKLTEQEKIILFIFLTFWTYYAFNVSKAFLWLIYGKELIKIDETAFYLKKSVLSYGKSVPYYFDNIKTFKFDIPEHGSIQSIWESSPWVNGGERMSFEYFNKNIKFGRKLNERDTKLLFNLVGKRIFERNKK